MFKKKNFAILCLFVSGHRPGINGSRQTTSARRVQMERASGTEGKENLSVSKSLSALETVDERIASDPMALHKVLSMLNPASAVEKYRQECARVDVKPFSTFIRQLQSATAVFDFSRSYFGERGILPVLLTLRVTPCVELIFTQCELSQDDVGHIYDALVVHATLTAVDLRQNTISLPSSRKLLSLVIKNKRITELRLDDNAPKALLIQKQCLSNAKMAVRSSACVFCSKPMVHAVLDNVESKIFLAIEERFGAKSERMSAVEVETILRCLLVCAEINDGVLFLCSHDCIQLLAIDILSAVHCVVSDCLLHIKTSVPKTPVVARCAAEVAEYYNNNPESITDHPDDWEVKEVDHTCDPSDEDWKPCTVCGRRSIVIYNGAAVAIKLLCRDLRRGANLRPSAFLRLLNVLVKYCKMKPCGVKCVRHLVRYGITGFGGVVIPQPNATERMLSSLNVPLSALPEADFTVVDFVSATVLDHGEEDTTCAVAVASLMSDIDGVIVDPYMIYATGRKIAKKSTENFGMELRDACEAVCVHGCLPCEHAPFRRDDRPPRSHYVDWDRWGNFADVESLEKISYARRREIVFSIDSELGNNFDRVRAALWAFKTQRRPAIVTIKFPLEWLQAEGGVIDTDKQPKGGIYTVVKIMGQTSINNIYYLIVQPNFGTAVGNRGFFYISRSPFNRAVRGSVYIFIDTFALKEAQGIELPLCYEALVPRPVVNCISQSSSIFDVLSFLANVSLRQVEVAQVKELRRVLDSMPPSLLFAYLSPSCHATPQFEVLGKQLSMLYRHSHGKSHLAFIWNEILGADASGWILFAANLLGSIRSANRNEESGSPALEMEVTMSVLRSLTTEVEEIEWIHCNVPALVEPQAIVPAPPATVQKKRKASNDNQPVDERRKSVWGRLKAFSNEKKKTSSVLTSRTSSSWDPTILGASTSMRTSVDAKEIPYEILSCRWNAINIPDEVGQPTSLSYFFIKDRVCKIDCREWSIVTPLHKMSDDVGFRNFPFSNGFDCVFHSSEGSTANVFFFSEGDWLLWDIRRNNSIDGPHSISTNPKFKNLPPEFHRQIWSAVEVPKTSKVVLFSCNCYVVFDVALHTVVGEVYELNNPSGPFQKLLEAFPRGPMSAFRWDWSTTLPSVPQEHLLLIGPDGSVAFSNLEPDASSRIKTLPICDSVLEALPLGFLQMTSNALRSMSESILKVIPADKVCNARVFVPLSPPASLGIAPSTPYPSLSVVWEIRISSTLTRENDASLTDIIQPLDESTGKALLKNLVLLRQTRASAEFEGHHKIDFDFGTVNPSRFAFLQIFMDVSGVNDRLLSLAPICAEVQCSGDGVAFANVSRFKITGSVAFQYWKPVHDARFWRIRFNNELPIGVGIVRVLWFKARWVFDSTPFDFAESFLPSEGVSISVSAPEILGSPRELLHDISPQPIFQLPSHDVWYSRHATLPILPSCDTCLFFCDRSFVEYDFDNDTVVGHRAIAFRNHPLFRDLPFPFSEGFDAAFYPDVNSPTKVCFVRDRWTLEWNMRTGKPIGDAVEFSDTRSLLFGMPFSNERLDDILNIWDVPYHVLIFQDTKVLRWNVRLKVVVEGPFIRDQLSIFNVPAFAQKRLLAVASFPNDKKTFYLFCEDMVAVNVVQPNQQVVKKPPAPFRHTDPFYLVARYIDWGAPRDRCVVTFDFYDKSPMPVGITMRSSDGYNPQTKFTLQYSDDNTHWSPVETHVQQMPRSSSNWEVAAVGGVGHRYWKLTSHPGTTTTSKPTVAYSQILFHVLPSCVFTVPPSRVSHNGVVHGNVTDLFSHGETAIEFVTSSGLSSSSRFLMLDYGDAPWPELTGFSCESSASRVSDLWRISYSDDALSWVECGKFRVRTKKCHLSWAPMLPRRYWKVEIEASLSGAKYSKLSLEEYCGPSLVSSDKDTDISRGIALLLPRVRGVAVVDILSAKGTCLSIDLKGSPQAFVGLALRPFTM